MKILKVQVDRSLPRRRGSKVEYPEENSDCQPNKSLITYQR